MKHEHQINVKIQKDGDGTYIAQVVEIPSITVRSENKENLKDEITIAMDRYFRAFPEEHERILLKEKDIEKIVATTTFEKMTITA